MADKEENQPELKKTETNLIVFKETENIGSITYQGFKAHLEAEDDTIFKKTELKKKFNEYQSKEAFIKK